MVYRKSITQSCYLENSDEYDDVEVDIKVFEPTDSQQKEIITETFINLYFDKLYRTLTKEQRVELRNNLGKLCKDMQDIIEVDYDERLQETAEELYPDEFI